MSSFNYKTKYNLKLTIVIIFFTSFYNLYANNFYYEFDKKIEVEENTYKSRSLNDVLEYKTTEGKTIKFKNEIIVKCKEENCDNNFHLHNITNYEKISKNFFIVYVQNDQNIFSLSQKLYEDKSIKIAHPNYVKTRKYR